MKSLSRVRLFATPWTAAHQGPPSMGFSRQEYWSGVPLPSPRPAARSKAGPITSNGQILALKSPLHASILLPNLYHLCPLPWKVSLFLPALKFLKFHAGNLHCLVAKLNVSNDLIITNISNVRNDPIDWIISEMNIFSVKLAQKAFI